MQIRIFHGLTCRECDTENCLVVDTGSDWIDWVCLDCKDEWVELIHPDERDGIDLTKLVYSMEKG
jgi:ribosomal silencing factor RsfS